MIRPLLLASFVAVGGFALGCSFDASEPPSEFEAWDLGDRVDGDTASTDGGEVVDGPTDSGSQTEDGGDGPRDADGFDDTGTDAAMTSDSGTDGGASDAGGTMNDAGTPDMAPAVCTANSECAAGDVCCPDLQGIGSCQAEADCLVGGLCGANTDCATGQECCDLSGIGSNDVCLSQCFGGGGGGTNCQTNADCSGANVCCPQLNGQAQCTPRNNCFTGGVCSTDIDCAGQQKCCNLQIGSLCFDRCSL